MLARISRHFLFICVLVRNIIGCAFVLSIIMALTASYNSVALQDMFHWEEMSSGVKVCIALALTFLPYGLTLIETPDAWHSEPRRDDDE